MRGKLYSKEYRNIRGTATTPGLRPGHPREEQIWESVPLSPLRAWPIGWQGSLLRCGADNILWEAVYGEVLCHQAPCARWWLPGEAAPEEMPRATGHLKHQVAPHVEGCWGGTH